MGVVDGVSVDVGVVDGVSVDVGGRPGVDAGAAVDVGVAAGLRAPPALMGSVRDRASAIASVSPAGPPLAWDDSSAAPGAPAPGNWAASFRMPRMMFSTWVASPA